MPIYCDEAGYTGLNLIEKNQPIFVYSGLNIGEEEAELFANSLKKKYRLQGELKGANLARSNEGQKAIKELYELYSDKVKIVFHHKKYALACKFYEYIFEPSLSTHNTAFYHTNFHRFIASLCYVSFMNTDESAEDIFLSFQDLLRGNDLDRIFTAFEQGAAFNNELIADVGRFALQQKETIIDEITISGEIAYWILDLTRTALYDILKVWGHDLQSELEVVCDTSKPLKEVVDSWDIFTTLHAKVVYGDILGNNIPINFSLNKPIEFKKSKECSGLQLADLFASSVYYALVNPKENISKFINKCLDGIVKQSGEYCIFPAPGLYLRPGSRDFEHGVFTLKKLVELSSKSPKNVGSRYARYMVRKLKAIQNKA